MFIASNQMPKRTCMATAMRLARGVRKSWGGVEEEALAGQWLVGLIFPEERDVVDVERPGESEEKCGAEDGPEQ